MQRNRPYAEIWMIDYADAKSYSAKFKDEA